MSEDLIVYYNETGSLQEVENLWCGRCGPGERACAQGLCQACTGRSRSLCLCGHGLLKKCWPLVIGCVLRTLQGIPLYLLKLGVSGAVGFDGNLLAIILIEP